ncbi:ankyrin repeat domain-containing protein SOWAHD [Myripristis murdjan]|uniref:Sosondowah ankyrin repeat domain family member D n=1 Tax=Myripristis murdjan TaxID=586833 RepID=A0A667ZAC4_9TELE|nr:ankyrin repeat domain-containing protein SOWAHD [Myripristis murdjan]XP_029917709.1 ankyrin repeat domain-containing protein SOWAHD [Myripristis murdjan]
MYESSSRSPDDADSAAVACGGSAPDREQAGPGPAPNNTDTHGRAPGRGAVVERLSRCGMQVLPSAFQRRSRLQRHQEVCESAPGALLRYSADAPERASLTPAMRKKYLKDLLLNDPSHSGFSSVLSSQTSRKSSRDEPDPPGTDWALYPMEHAWMLSAVDGNYETILEFISADPQLLTRRDFISGFSVLHWLAKRGQDETLIQLLRHAEAAGIPVNVNLRGSGGLTPLHVATMHSQYMVVKLLVGAFGANVDAMDYNGRRAWQYLKGNAPPEMKELLGAWDDEHSCQGALNVNNNSANNIMNVDACETNDEGGRDEVDSFDWTKRNGSWRFGSLRKLWSQFSFRGNKS